MKAAADTPATQEGRWQISRHRPEVRRYLSPASSSLSARCPGTTYSYHNAAYLRRRDKTRRLETRCRLLRRRAAGRGNAGVDIKAILARSVLFNSSGTKAAAMADFSSISGRLPAPIYGRRHFPQCPSADCRFRRYSYFFSIATNYFLIS